MVPKEVRRRRLTCINTTVQDGPASKQGSRGATHTKGAVMSLSTLYVMTPLVLFVSTFVFSVYEVYSIEFLQIYP